MTGSGAGGPRGRSAAAHVPRPAVLWLLGVGAAVLAFQLWIDPTNPPGFMEDEASFAYSAWSLGHSLRDQYGGLLPLYLTSFGDYKSSLFSYLLAPVFRVTGPHASVARALGTADVIAALGVLALIAVRRTRPLVAAIVVALAGFSPWLYEVGRYAFDSTLYPLAVASVLLLTDISLRSRRPLLVRAAYVSLALGFLTYCYAGGRGLGPLVAAALVVFLSRERWRWLVAVWVGYALLWIPNIVYMLRHPGALTARLNDTTFVQTGASTAVSVWQGIQNYVYDAGLWHMVVAGNVAPYIAQPGHVGLFAALALLGLVGIVEIVWHRRGDRWWIFVICVMMLIAVPAALTSDRSNPMRLSPQVIVLAVLAIPALELLLRLRLQPRFRIPVTVGLVALAGLTVAQWVQFVRPSPSNAYSARESRYGIQVPTLLQQAFSGGQTVYIDQNDVRAQTHALWYAVSTGLPQSRVVVLSDGRLPPTGGSVFGRQAPCSNTICLQVGSDGTYWIARSLGPKPAAPTVAYGAGFNGTETFRGAPSRWMIQHGHLILQSPQAQWATLTGSGFSNAQPRVLALETTTGRVLAQQTINSTETTISLGPIHIPKGSSSLVLVATPGPARLGPTDPRLASVFLQPLTWITQTMVTRAP